MDRLQGNGLQVGQGNVVEIFIFDNHYNDLDKATGELHCQHQVNAGMGPLVECILVCCGWTVCNWEGR